MMLVGFCLPTRLGMRLCGCSFFSKRCPQHDANRFLPTRAVLGEILIVVIKNTRIYKKLPVRLKGGEFQNEKEIHGYKKNLPA